MMIVSGNLCLGVNNDMDTQDIIIALEGLRIAIPYEHRELANKEIKPIVAAIVKIDEEIKALIEREYKHILRSCGVNADGWMCTCKRCGKPFGSYKDANRSDCRDTVKMRIRYIEDLNCQCNKLQAELEKHRWIPVSERLPEMSGQYLVMLNYDHPQNLSIHMKHPAVASYFKDDALWGTEKHITHWKPIILPEQALKGN